MNIFNNRVAANLLFGNKLGKKSVPNHSSSFEDVLANSKNESKDSKVSKTEHSEKDDDVKKYADKNVKEHNVSKNESKKKNTKVSDKSDSTDDDKLKDEKVLDEDKSIQEQIDNIIELLKELGIDFEDIKDDALVQLSNNGDISQWLDNAESILGQGQITKKDLKEALEKLTAVIKMVADGQMNVNKEDNKKLLQLLKSFKEKVELDQTKDTKMNSVDDITKENFSKPVFDVRAVMSKSKKEADAKNNLIMPVKIVNIDGKMSIGNSQVFLNMSQNLQDVGQTVSKEAIPVADVDFQSLIDQVTKGTLKVIEEDQSMINIKLKPETLGNMTLKVVVEEGKVTAEAVVESQAVKNILLSNISELRENLSRQGLDVSQIDVSVGEENFFDQNQQQSGNFQRENKNSKKIKMSLVNDVSEVNDTEDMQDHMSSGFSTKA